MKHLTKSIAALFGITILLSACKKDDEPVVSPPEPVPGSIELQSYFRLLLNCLLQRLQL